MAVAETGGFAKAAVQFGSSPPAVTRLIASLEARLGVQLFNRTTRIVDLTEPGRRLIRSVRALLLDLEDAEKEAIGEGGVLSGHLTLTASGTICRSLLPPIVDMLLNANPRVSATLLLLDRVANLIEEGVDIALRVERLPGSNLISTRIGRAAIARGSRRDSATRDRRLEDLDELSAVSRLNDRRLAHRPTHHLPPPRIIISGARRLIIPTR